MEAAAEEWHNRVRAVNIASKFAQSREGGIGRLDEITYLLCDANGVVDRNPLFRKLDQLEDQITDPFSEVRCDANEDEI